MSPVPRSGMRAGFLTFETPSDQDVLYRLPSVMVRDVIGVKFAIDGGTNPKPPASSSTSAGASPTPPHRVAYSKERVTGIEPGLSARESDRSGPLTALTWGLDALLVTVIDLVTPRLMARQWPVPDGPGSGWASGGHHLH